MNTALNLYRIMHELDEILETIKSRDYEPGIFGAAVSVSIAAARVERLAEKKLDASDFGRE